MTKAVRFHKTGGPEVLVYEDVEVGAPGEGQARVRNKAIGLNFIDTYHRSGLYPLQRPRP
jgi:NADPH:quinone reductase